MEQPLDPYLRSATLLRAVDGDTGIFLIDLGYRITTTQVCRLYGIDTPELRGEEREAGLAAKAHLEQLIATRPLVVRSYRNPQDKYGRYLLTVYADGVDINQRMIDDGHAVAYFG